MTEVTGLKTKGHIL